MLKRLLVEVLRGCEQVAACRPRVRRRSRHVAVSEVLGRPAGMGGTPLELRRRVLVELRSSLEPLAHVLRDAHASFATTCLICVYSSIEYADMSLPYPELL